MKDVLIRRLTGAAVLLSVAFAAASLLPSPQPGAAGGAFVSDPGERRVVTYDLGGGRPVGLRLDKQIEAPAGESRPARTAPDRPAPEPPTPAAETPPSTPVTVATRPAATPEPPAPAESEPDRDPPDADAERWSVQVASFADPNNARKTRDRLKGNKLRAHVQEVHVGNAVWFRVRVGPFPNESQAKTALAQVKRLDFRGARLVQE